MFFHRPKVKLVINPSVLLKKTYRIDTGSVNSNTFNLQKEQKVTKFVCIQ